jgi:hypothetical protein
MKPAKSVLFLPVRNPLALLDDRHAGRESIFTRSGVISNTSGAAGCPGRSVPAA